MVGFVMMREGARPPALCRSRFKSFVGRRASEALAVAFSLVKPLSRSAGAVGRGVGSTYRTPPQCYFPFRERIRAAG